MQRDFVNQTCAGFPGATLEDPWGGGHDAWKVYGKMFACIGVADTGVSVKTPDIETAEMLIAAGRALKAPYFHRSWVHVPWDHVDAVEMRDRLSTSYSIIRRGLSKKTQASLGSWHG